MKPDRTDEIALEILQRHSSFVEVRSHRLRVVHVPRRVASDAAVVFLHGFGGQAEQFARQLAFFAERVDLLTFDNLGHGQSDAPPGDELYAADTLVQDILELIARHCPSQRLVLVGHSYGTSLLCRVVAGLDCARVVGCILISPTLASRFPDPWLAKLAPCFMLDALRLYERWGGPNSRSVQRMVDVSASVAVRQKQLRWNMHTPSHVVRSMLRGLNMATLEEYCTLPMSVLVVVGQNDAITPVEDAYAIYKSTLQTPFAVFPASKPANFFPPRPSQAARTACSSQDRAQPHGRVRRAAERSHFRVSGQEM
eukprot:m.113523 g.113523  ORF g.113523 m.113523 type:complete len:311 (-) comp19317_c1_seq3:603-1535(-)